MADCKYIVERANLHNVRKQTSDYLCDIDTRLEAIVEYLGSAPSGGIVLSYQFDTAVSGNPGAGHIATDNVDHTLVTSLRMSEVTKPGNNVGIIIQALDAKDVVGIFEIPAPNSTAYFRLTGTPVLNVSGDYYDIPVENLPFVGEDLPVVDDVDVDVYLVANAGRLLPPGGDAGDILEKATGDDYDTQWVDGLTKYFPANGDHDDLSNVTPDQHHNQIHNLYGSDQGDVLVDGLAELRDGLFWSGSSWSRDRRTRYIPEGFVLGQTYQRGDEVSNGSQISEALVDNASQSPFIEPTGEPQNPFDGTMINAQEIAKLVTFGTRYTLSQGGYLVGYRLYVYVGNRYDVFVVLDPLGSPAVRELISFTAVSDGWVNLTVPTQIVVAGTVFDLSCRVSAPDPAPTVFSYDWNYVTPQNALPPFAGEIIHANSTPDVLIVNAIDSGAVDRTADLALVTVGDSIQANEVQWTVLNVTTEPGIFYFTVAPATQTSPDGITSFLFNVVVAQDTLYAEDINYWLTNQPTYATVQGLFGVDVEYSTITPNDTAYGTDLTLQAAYIPTEWAVKSITAGGGGGGEFTPSLFTGAGTTGYVPDPIIEDGTALFDTGQWLAVYTKQEIDNEFVEEAPIDGVTYGRKDDAWNPVYDRGEVDEKIEWIVEQDDRSCAWGERVRFDTPPNEAYLPAPTQDVSGTSLLSDILLWNDSNIPDEDVLVVPFPGTFFTFNGRNYAIDETLSLSPGEICRVVTRVTNDSYAFAIEAAAGFAGANSFGFVQNSDGIETLRYLADDGTWQNLVQIPVGGIRFPYIFSTETSYTDPGDGYVRIDNADPSLADAVIISLTNNNGNDTSLWIQNLKQGDFIGVVDEINGTGYYYRVLYPANLVGDAWAVIDITLYKQDGTIANDAPVFAVFVGNPENRIPEGGNENDVLAKASGANYSLYWRDIDSTFALDNVPQDGFTYGRYWDGSALEWNTGRVNPAKFIKMEINASTTTPVGSEGGGFGLVVANTSPAVIGIQGGAGTNSQLAFGEINSGPWYCGITLDLTDFTWQFWNGAMELTFGDPSDPQPKASLSRGWLGVNLDTDKTMSNVQAPLHVNGGIVVGDTTFNPAVLYENSIEVRSINNATAYPVCVLRNQGNTSYTAGSLVGSFQFYANDSSSSLQGIKASVNAYRSDTFGARAGLSFCTTDSVNNTERMWLNQLGNLLIGSNIDRGGKITATDFLDIRRNTDGWLLRHTRTDDNQAMGIYAVGHSQSQMAIYTGASERVRISNGGAVGINVTDPLYRLDVNAGAVNSAARIATTNNVSDTIFESGTGFAKIRTTAGALQFDVNGQVSYGTALYLTPAAKTRIGSSASAGFDAICTVRDPNGFGNNVGDVSNAFEIVAQSNNGANNAVNFLMGYERTDAAYTSWSGVKQFLKFSVGTNLNTTGGIAYNRPSTATATAEMTFHVGSNVERMRINSAGRLMVGTTTQAGAIGSINIAAGANYYINGIPISTFIDAPSDGNLYARKNSAWSSIGAGAGTVSDLSMTQDAVNSTINNTGGDGAVILAATTTESGVMTAEDKSKLDAIPEDANNYVHPAYTARNLDIDTGALTGAWVISDLDFNVVSNTIGSVTAASGAFSVRALTLLDIGYTGDPNANDYVHPSYTARNSSVDSGALSGATVISDIDMNLNSDEEGHVTSSGMSINTRELTPADIGAAEAGAAPQVYAFTPSFVGASGGSITGKVYLSVANEMVTVTGRIQWTTAPTGSAQVRVTVAAVPCVQNTGFGFSGVGVENQANAANGMNCTMSSGQAYFSVWGYNENGVRNATTYNMMNANGSIDINFTYYAGSLA